jgi:hypothetical protein
VALDGFGDLAAALGAVDAAPMARMRAYLDFAAANPRVYEAMFSMPSGLHFAAEADGTRAEVAWAAVHGLATLQAAGRLRGSHVQARLDLVHSMLTRPGAR